ncbi:MAG: TnpV protein [Slackia sp.]
MINWVSLTFFKKRRRAMLTNQAFSGYALMRLQFLQAEDPDSLREMESNGTLAGHLEKVERLTNERRSELELLLMQEEGATEALKATRGCGCPKRRPRRQKPGVGNPRSGGSNLENPS